MPPTTNERRVVLENQRADILAAMDVLAQDRRDGLIEQAAYDETLRQYQQEDLKIRQELDRLPPDHRQVPSPRRAWTKLLPAVVVLAFIAALALLLTASLRGGSTPAGGTATSASSTSSSPDSREIAAAWASLRRHGRTLNGLLALGNAYLQSGQAKQADAAYRNALRLRPGDARATTLHAMALSAQGRDTLAVSTLRTVERDHPTFARAWLLDGMLSSHDVHRQRHAVSAWRRFLQLQPTGPVSVEVRQLIAAAKKGSRRL